MAGLLLDSLDVRNYRTFEHLRLNHLGEVNLITGKNNVGKTSLPAAIWLYARGGIPCQIDELLRDALWSRAAACVESIPAAERLFLEQHTAKAYVHTWLVWQEEPGTPMGQALEKRYLDPQAPAASAFVQWFNQLFPL